MPKYRHSLPAKRSFAERKKTSSQKAVARDVLRSISSGSCLLTRKTPDEEVDPKMEHTEQAKSQAKPQTKPQFEIESLEERIAPSVMTGPTGIGHGYPGPGAGGTIGAAQYHTAGSDSPFIAF